MSAPAAPEPLEPTPDQTPAPVDTPTPPPEAPADPPAAAVVIRSARELELEENLTKEQKRALEAERKAAELERDNQELKKVHSRPAKAPKAAGYRWNWAAKK